MVKLENPKSWNNIPGLGIKLKFGSSWVAGTYQCTVPLDGIAVWHLRGPIFSTGSRNCKICMSRIWFLCLKCLALRSGWVIQFGWSAQRSSSSTDNKYGYRNQGVVQKLERVNTGDERKELNLSKWTYLSAPLKADPAEKQLRRIKPDWLHYSALATTVPSN